MDPGLSTYIAGTVALWAISGTGAVLIAALLAAGALGRSRVGRAASGVLTTLTRGVPTSLLVVAGGVAAAGITSPGWLPNLFPGTPDGLEVVSWSIVVALALGSAGHLAVIFETACRTLGTSHRDQLALLALSGPAQFRLMVREAARTGLAPTGARLVHHLHNTAFAALFPVADLFGWVQQQANETFEIGRYATVGVAGYVVLSFTIWAVCRGLEHRLRPRATAARQAVPA